MGTTDTGSASGGVTREDKAQDLYLLGNASDALLLCKNRLKNERDDISTLCLAALSAKALGQEDDAQAFLAQAKSLSLEKTLLYWIVTIDQFRERHYYLQAITAGIWLIEQGVASPGLYHNIGITYQSLGKGSNAEACFRKALELDPAFFPSMVPLLRMTKITNSDRDKVEQLERVFATRNGTAYALARQANALGNAYENLEDYAKSFEYYTLANQYDAQTKPLFDFPKRLNAAKITKTVYTPALFEQFKGAGCPDPTPILVVGMPRSGTSLTEQILASHPDVAGAGELMDVEKHLLHGVFNALCQGKATPEMLSDAGENYVNALRSHAPDAKYIVDKMPENFWHLGLVKLALPNAKIIHCARGFRANCFSIFKTVFDADMTYANDQKNIALYHALYHDMIHYWTKLFGSQIHHAYYEKMIGAPREEMQKLLDYCGLSWDENVTRFYETKRAVKTASINQVNKPLYKDALNAYEPFTPYLTEMFTLLADGNALRAEVEARLKGEKAAA
jgi:tetratricopeptide (TPR) repeat protein